MSVQELISTAKSNYESNGGPVFRALNAAIHEDPSMAASLVDALKAILSAAGVPLDSYDNGPDLVDAMNAWEKTQTSDDVIQIFDKAIA